MSRDGRDRLRHLVGGREQVELSPDLGEVVIGIHPQLTALAFFIDAIRLGDRRLAHLGRDHALLGGRSDGSVGTFRVLTLHLGLHRFGYPTVQPEVIHVDLIYPPDFS